MFEDSTFESTGRIRTRSRRWMIAALGLNGGILLALIVIPLIYPEALPIQSISVLIAAPPPPLSEAPAPQHPTARLAAGPAVELPDPMAAPPRIPTTILTQGPEPVGPSPIGNLDLGRSGDTVGSIGTALPSPPPRVVHQPANVPVRLPSTVVASSLIYKVIPIYPAIGKAVGVQGTVVLAATISKAGMIEDLRVMSGPPMLQTAALDAVKQWRYKPYLLNGEPVAVETTVNVVFTLQR